MIEALQKRQLLSQPLTKLALEAIDKCLPSGYNLEEYFKQAKWIMVLNESLYREYLKNQLRPALESDLTLVNKHGEPNLLALKDEDIL